MLIPTLMVFASCAVTKVVSGPTGQWEVKITGTPYGDMSALMNISAGTPQWKASFTAQGETINMDQFNYDPKTGKTTGSFIYMGNSVSLDAIVKEAMMEGNLSAAGAEFPIKGTKKP